MRSGGLPDGFPHQTPGTVNWTINSDFDNMCDAADRTLAAVTNAVIRDLVPAQSCAIHHEYLNAVYRFSERYPFHRAIEDAKENLVLGLKRKGLWLGV
jgi:hypothetical protein